MVRRKKITASAAKVKPGKAKKTQKAGVAKKRKASVKKEAHQTKQAKQAKQTGKVVLDVRVSQTDDVDLSPAKAKSGKASKQLTPLNLRQDKQLKKGSGFREQKDLAEREVSASMSRIEQPDEIKRKKKEKKKKVKRKKAVLRQTRKTKSQDRKTKIPAELIKAERDKQLIMIAGVSFFMILIFFVWIMNVKQVFKRSVAEESNDSSLQEISEITEQFSQAIDEMRQGIADIKSELSTATTSTTNEIESPPSPDKDKEFSEKDIEALKKRLEELEQNMEDIKPL